MNNPPPDWFLSPGRSDLKEDEKKTLNVFIIDNLKDLLWAFRKAAALKQTAFISFLFA